MSKFCLFLSLLDCQLVGRSEIWLFDYFCKMSSRTFPSISQQIYSKKLINFVIWNDNFLTYTHSWLSLTPSHTHNLERLSHREISSTTLIRTWLQIFRITLRQDKYQNHIEEDPGVPLVTCGLHPHCWTLLGISLKVQDE